MSPIALGKPFAVLLMGETETGEDDWAVFSGILRERASGLFLDRGAKPAFEIDAEWYDRIKPVGAEVKDILLGAEFYLALSVGPVPDGKSMEEYAFTGLKWPK